MSGHEDPFPMKTKVEELLAAEGCPDPKAKIVGSSREKKLGGSNSYHRVTQLQVGAKIVGVKIVHRRPGGEQTLHVHTDHWVQMLEYLAAALIV